MLNFDCLTHISLLTDFKTRVQLKLTCKTLHSKISIQLLTNESIINTSFIKNVDNCWIWTEFFCRTYVTPYMNLPEEPYLVTYNEDTGLGEVLYSPSPGDVYFSRKLNQKQAEDFERLWEIWFDDDDEHIPTYTAKGLWDKMLNEAFDNYNYFNWVCIALKLNPGCPRIVGNEYIGKDFFTHNYDLDRVDLKQFGVCETK